MTQTMLQVHHARAAELHAAAREVRLARDLRPRRRTLRRRTTRVEA
jgi:hypothetical protein